MRADTKCKQGDRWLGIDLRKTAMDADAFGLMRKATCTGATARVPGQSSVVIDPSARLETSYTRTGRPRGACRRSTTESSSRKCSRNSPIEGGVNGRTAGEGVGHKTRGQATEESHIGIKERSKDTSESSNRPNKDGEPSAEGEEGRPMIKDQGERPPTTHVLDSERDKRVPEAGGRAESSKGK